MPKAKFSLINYVRDIQNIARENNCSNEQAMQYFLANLAIMNDRYKGASHLNFRQLGQLWNGLSSDERVAQKADIRVRLNRSNRGGSAE